MFKENKKKETPKEILSILNLSNYQLKSKLVTLGRPLEMVKTAKSRLAARNRLTRSVTRSLDFMDAKLPVLELGSKDASEECALVMQDG